MLTPIPSNEAARLEALARYRVLDTPAEASFDRITALASRLFEVPIALVTLLDQDRVWFKSCFGVEAASVERDEAFCAYTILQEDIFVVPDAAQDSRFARSPVVVSAPFARFYAGAPLVTADGFRLGTLCLLDRVPRTFDDTQAATLRDLAAMVVEVLEARRTAGLMAGEIAERRSAEARKNAVLDAALDGIITINHEGRVIELNHAAETMFGYPAEQAVGQELAELIIPPAYRAAHRRGMAHFLATGEGPVLNKRLELSAVRADGSEFPIELAITRIAADGPPVFTGHIRDISARRAIENRLRMLESSVEHANDAIVITEAEPVGEPGPRIIYVNQAFTSTTGFTLEEVLGKTPRILQGPDTSQEAKATIRHGLKRWKPVRVELLNYRKDGSEFWVELNIVPVADEKGWYTHWVSVQRDITARKQTESVLVRAKQDAEEAQAEAERANLAKSEFLSRMSHELRTPLNAILGFGQLLEMEAQSDRQRERLSHILKGGQHLLDLINEVLDIARIESGKMELTLEAIPVAEVLRDVAALIRPLADQRNIRLGRCAGAACEGNVWADRQRLSQVVLNLLSNAVKYNRPGGSVSLICDPGAQPGQLRLAIGDTGPGIAPENLPKLFTPFERLGAEQSNVEGTGIGLALCKGLVEAMGGRIGVESVVGQGSTFYVELASSTAASHTAEMAPVETSAYSDVGRHTILCIEDNLANFALIEQALEAMRPDVHLLGAMQGQLGMDMAREHRPDLILLDLQLPDVSGDKVLRQLQAEAATRDIPVIMISADATKGQVQRLLDLGARSYLTKPINIRMFLRTIDDALAERSAVLLGSNSDL